MIVTDSDAIQADGICRAVGAALQKAYPGRMWFVDVSISGGVVTVQAPKITSRHGYVLKMKDYPTTEWLQRAAIKAGGEILERFSLSRERPGGEESLRRDARGEAIQ